MPSVTVLVPTHDHGPTLRHSLRSVQDQTVDDLEIFVVGDGVPDATRTLVTELAFGDSRIRFFDNPKGPRNGELHRHAVLAEARGEIVCYQTDDDLWRPGHVEVLQRLLATADFAHTVALDVGADGAVFPWLAVLESGVFRALMQRGSNFLPLNVVGHTLAAYRALPHGWRTTPAGTPTDLYMWQQFLEQPGIRFASGSEPTVLHFASPPRRDWELDERCRELEEWRDLVAGLEWRTKLEPMLTALCAAGVLRLRRRLGRLEPLAPVARTRHLLGKVPRRLTSELWLREVRRAALRRAGTQWLVGDPQLRP